MEQVAEVEGRKPAVVKIYDYYDKGKRRSGTESFYNHLTKIGDFNSTKFHLIYGILIYTGILILPNN